jgi:beta-galactosidase
MTLRGVGVGAWLGALLLACTEESAPPAQDFPDDFMFGAALAGFQADMGCPTLPASQCVDRNSDWYVFTTTPKLVADPGAYLSGQDPAVVGPGFWELYPQDIERAADELHHDALRMSFEWSRIFPTATDDVEGYEALKKIASADAIAHYHDVLRELKAHGMRPLVTLYHYALPTWIHDAEGCHEDLETCSPRGWVDKERTVREAAKYAEFCAREFGSEVDLWATLNEPLQNMVFGYLLPNPARSHPPAQFLKAEAARTVFDALIDAHARMYDAVKEGDQEDADGDGRESWVGVVYPFVPVEPADPEQDAEAAENIDYLWNQAYLEAVVHGRYDAAMDGNTVDRPDLAGRMDYIGFNWYGGLRVEGTPRSTLPALSPLFTVNPATLVETPNQPEQLARFLRYVNEDLGLPAIITENGATDPDDDGSGGKFIVANLRAVADALADGADVRGYFYWTLTDNYEWNHGMDIRMGLYAVDKDDAKKARKARKSVAVYAKIAETRTLPE